MKKISALSLISILAIGSMSSCKKCGECVATVGGVSTGEVCYTKTADYDAAKAACNNTLGVYEWKAK